MITVSTLKRIHIILNHFHKIKTIRGLLVDCCVERKQPGVSRAASAVLPLPFLPLQARQGGPATSNRKAPLPANHSIAECLGYTHEIAWKTQYTLLIARSSLNDVVARRITKCGEDGLLCP